MRPRGWSTYEDFKRANRMLRRNRLPDLGVSAADPYEPTFAEFQRGAAGAWAFVIDLEAEDRLTRRLSRWR